MQAETTGLPINNSPSNLYDIRFIVGCAGSELSGPDVVPEQPEFLENGEPSVITVQHCLIGFVGSVRGKTISRSKDAAGELAAKLLEKAKSGESFDAIVKAYTNDSPPGIYTLANTGVRADSRSGIYSRDGMVPAFGDVGFKLKVGEYGMSEHDPIASPYGWHIIKRIK